ncbi:MAG: toprim domain-containing protein [Streptosporangiaceae bacterium]|nr:toprim domain-containing protein [Streptosporangiaceae bacterium]
MLPCPLTLENVDEYGVRHLVAVTRAAARFFACLAEGSWVPGYLASRGFEPDTWRWRGVGYAPAAWDELTAHLRDLGFTDPAIRAAGLAKWSGRGALIDIFRDRVMFPIRSMDGTVAGFIGRAPPGADPSIPAYLNSPTSALYRKGQVLFGLCEAQPAVATGSRLVITEGPLDAMAVTVADPARYAGVALCGTALTHGQARLLATLDWARVPARHDPCLGAAGVVVALDGDRAGRLAAVRAHRLLRGVTDDLAAVSFPPGSDPASYFREHGSAALAGLLDSSARPLADLVIDGTAARFDRWVEFTDGKFLALRAVAPLIAGLPPGQVARQVARVAERLALTHAEVTEAVTTALSESPPPAP